MDLTPPRYTLGCSSGMCRTQPTERKLSSSTCVPAAGSGTVALPFDYYGPPAAFTSPTGKNVVVLTDDGTTQRVERRTRSGAVLAVLREQTSPSDVRRSLEWLYGYDGTFALIKTAGGIEFVENDGTFVRDLWTPMGRTHTRAMVVHRLVPRVLSRGRVGVRSRLLLTALDPRDR